MLQPHLVSEAHLLDLPEDKDAAIGAAVAALAKAVKLDAAALLKAVMARETVMSTGMGHGVAIPHAKIAEIDDFRISICRSMSPIDYHSLDSTPVRILVLMLSPEERTKDHVRMIADITKRLKFSSVRQAILDTKDTKEMEQAILSHR